MDQNSFVNLKSFPFVQKIINDNDKLKKKNKELRKLIKLISSNIDILKPNIDTSKTIIKQEPIDDIEIIEPSQKENVYIEIKDEFNEKNYKDDSCSFNLILNDVKTIEDYNKLTIFYQKLWLQNNSLDSLIKTQSNNKKEVEVDKKEEDVEVVEEEEEEVVEEEEEEVVEEEEEEEEEEEDEEEEEEEVEEEEEDDEDVFEIIINKKTYYTTDMKNGVIYDMDSDGEISLEVGKLTDGKHKFYK